VGEAVLDEHHAPAVAREPLQGAARLDVAQRARHHHRPGRLPTPPDDRRLAHDDEGQRPALGHAVLVRPRQAHAGLRLAGGGLAAGFATPTRAGTTPGRPVTWPSGPTDSMVAEARAGARAASVPRHAPSRPSAARRALTRLALPGGTHERPRGRDR